MPTYSVSKTWNAAETLTAADLNGIEAQVQTFLNTTKLDGDNISATATYTFGGIVLGSGGPASPDGGNLHSFNGDASASAHADADEGVFENSTAAGISILSGASSAGNIFFGDSGDNDIGKISYSHSTNTFTVTANAVATMTIVNTAVTLGVDDTGVDLKAFGASAGAFFEWDESGDHLEVRGATAAGPGVVQLTTGETTVVDGDVLGRIEFTAPAEASGTDAILPGAAIWAEADATFDASTNTTNLVFATATSATAVGNGTMTLDEAALYPNTTDGLALGTSSLNWADLFLDSGAVIDFDSANVVLTHSAGVLNVSTGALQVGGTAVATTGANTFTGDQTFNDNVNLTLGTGGDVDLSYNGTDLVLDTQVVGSGDFVINNGAVGINRTPDGSGRLEVQNATAANSAGLYMIHTDNTNTGSHAKLQLVAGGASGGDPFTQYSISGVTSWYTGVDNSDSDKFKIASDGGFASEDIITLNTGNGNIACDVRNHGNSTPNGVQIHFPAATPDNNSQYHLICGDATTTRCYIWSDGDLANHDGTYGTISDVKFKQDIVDARSYWDDFKQLQYRKFRHKSDVEVDANAPYRLGLVAQEVELVFPALVPESPDDPNDEASTTHKWVKSSIIEGPIMASVVQELQARVEALEAK